MAFKIQRLGLTPMGVITLLEKTNIQKIKEKKKNNGWLPLPLFPLPMPEFKDSVLSQATAVTFEFINLSFGLSKPLVLKLEYIRESSRKLAKFQYLGLSSRESDFYYVQSGHWHFSKLSRWF